MINAWLDLPPSGIFGTLALVHLGLGLGLWCLVCKTRLVSQFGSLDVLVAPFFSSVAVLFALLSGFLAIDVGERNKQAHARVQSEAAALHNMHTLSIASASDMRTIRAKITTYARVAAQDDWPAMVQGGHSAAADLAYDELLREVSNPSISRDSGVVVHQALLNAAIEVGQARSSRIALSSDRTNHLKWISVLILAIITQVAIGLVHLKHSGRAFLTAQMTFAIAVVVALGIIALQETTFGGALHVSPAPIERLASLPINIPRPSALD